MKKNENVPALETQSSNMQHEDTALKVTAQFFKDEILPYLGIEGKVVGIAPTESVHLDLKKGFQDMNFIMEDGSLRHFEFQSTNEGLAGLKRFRVYESLMSYQHKTTVTTYVLFSGRIKNPMTEFTEGINTYRIQPIIMQDKNADKVIATLQEKTASSQTLTNADLLPLALCLLMGGTMSPMDRVRAAYEITQRATATDAEAIQKVEAVIYVMTDKFLETAEMEQLKKEIKMTRLGQMIFDDGKAEGISQGISQGIRSLVKACKDLGAQKEYTIERVIQDFSISREQAESDVAKYWD